MSNVFAEPSDDTTGSAVRLVSLWWLFGIGGEEAAPTEACRADGCGQQLSSVDVFCPDVDHGDLLVFQDQPVGRTRWWLVNLVRSIVVGLVVLAAAYETPWPIYVLAVAAGLALIWLPLRAHVVAPLLGVGWWLTVAAAGAVIAAADLGSGGMHAVWTVAVGLPLVLTLASGALGPIVVTQEEPSGVEREATRGVAGSLVLAALALITWWLATGPLADRFVDPPGWAERWLLFAALGSVLGVLLVATVGAFLVSFGALNLEVRPRIKRFPERRRVDWSFTPRPIPAGRSAASIVLRQLTNQLRRSAKALARTTANGLLAFYNAGQRAACRLVNWGHRRVLLFGRRVAFVVRRAGRIIGEGAVCALGVAVLSVAPLVTYGAGIAGVAASLALSTQFTDYLVDGPLAALFAGAAWSALGIAACFVVWERLSSVTAAEAVRSEYRFLTRMAPDVALFTIAAGWVVGIPGTLGYGPIRVGWVTLVGTAVLAVLLGQEEIGDWRNRRRERHAGASAVVATSDAAMSTEGP